jgi:hypothetical protein
MVWSRGSMGFILLLVGPSAKLRVIPAEAGIQINQELGWIPAFAGMTVAR